MIDGKLFEKCHQEAAKLSENLASHGQKIVFAESCTAGLVSAILAQIPGISQHLCGSLVTYRESAKTDWLTIDPSLIALHSAVSSEVTLAMVQSALSMTNDADVAVAITGHLEPNASPIGTMSYIGLSRRRDQEITLATMVKISLTAKDRTTRQWQAACGALEVANEFYHGISCDDGTNPV